MFTLYRITFPPARKTYQIGLLFTHTNGDLGAKLHGTDLKVDRFLSISPESEVVFASSRKQMNRSEDWNPVQGSNNSELRIGI